MSNALQEIEQRESRLLVWGIVDGYFERSELIEVLDTLIDLALNEGFSEFSKADGVIDALLRLQLIVEVESASEAGAYRSRMAETVRLLLRLRQLLPKHARPGAWQQAPALVADYRFQRRQRQYPRRDVSKDEAIRRLRSVTSNAAMLRALSALVPSGQDFKLAAFQVRAAERIIRALESGAALGTIVCAGTGSGKTLAFYIPALASIARHRLTAGNERPWVKAVAIYPRIELLKDQLREVLSRTLHLSSSLPNIQFRIGALFGDTPKSARWCDWPTIGTDRICPSLRCVNCNGDLRWAQADFSVGKERLRCSTCDFEIDGRVFPLTREAMAQVPPDILFTTTEMLNRRLSDNSMCHLFGVGAKAHRPPELVLLDEIHTYDGRHGAQVAYLMRRWQCLVEHALRFVGLSATLREASAFLASLTGCRQSLIEEVSPRGDEIESEGAEYMIALRGDPVSRAALLSTTIQTTMLLQRCLDPRTADLKDSVSAGAFGQRTFVFTDNLDVINRLYFDLMSAEGRTSSGSPDMRRAPNGGLAGLRKSGASQSRYRNGQDWRLCETLGHQLSHRLVIERVSSQDRGIDSDADVVVATATLEVGFDDPTVGAVIQHKAPKGMAGFLQRKGRAGRTRGMRPWMAIVLSDYGRDRIAYQGYDLLFDPELPVRTLPLSNRYIIRMQAVFATIDFLGQRLQNAPDGSVWLDLAGPTHPRRAMYLQKEIRDILEFDNGATRLGDYLQKALRLPSDQVSALLWEYPRPLMTTILPTALRRLATNWRADGQPNRDFQVRNNPLPEFVPASLFSDLNLAEVRIDLPHLTEEEKDDRPVMPVFSALREFAAGRISRRFGVRYRTDRLWLAPFAESQSVNLSEDPESTLDIETFGTYSFLGNFSVTQDEATIPIPTFQPISLKPSVPPTNISDSSNANLLWKSQFVPSGEPNWLSPPIGSVWSQLVPKIGFYMHAYQTPVEVRRFTTGAAAEIGIGPAKKNRIAITFNHKTAGTHVALGATFPADGVVFQLRIPVALCRHTETGSELKWRSLRTARFIDMAWRGEFLREVPSPFMRDWLAQIFLSALTFEAINRTVSLADAALSLANGSALITMNQVLVILFQANVVEDQDDPSVQGGQDKLRQELEECLQTPTIVAELHEMAQVLYESISESWEPWLRRVYQSTFAAAVLRAITDLCPAIDPDDLSVDLDRGAMPDGHEGPSDSAIVEVWITENSPGGSGLIEEFLRSYSEDPRRFFSLVRTSLEMGEFELIDHQLKGLLRIMVDNEKDSRVRELVRQFRMATNQEQMSHTSRLLRLALVREGFSPFHGFVVSMGNRILRAGAGTATDHYLEVVMQRWDAEEERLGLEIDLRVVCYWLSQSPDIDALISEVGIPVGQDTGAWRMSAIYGLLWARGRVIRQTSLQLRNPFADLPPTERLLVAESVSDDRVLVSVHNPNWLEQTSELLATGRLVTLTCSESQRPRLGDALSALITNPVDAGYIRAYARLQGVRQSNDVLEADIELVEAVQ